MTFLGLRTRLAPFANPRSSISAIAVNSTGRVYVTGSTYDPGFLNVARHAVLSRVRPPIAADFYLATLDPTGSAATLLQKSCGRRPQRIAVAVDSRGAVAATGIADSADPGSRARFASSAGDPASGTVLEWPLNFLASRVAFDASGSLHTAGGVGLILSFTPAQILAPRVYGVANSAGGLLAGRIAPGELFSIYGLKFGVAAQAAAFDSAGLLPKVFGGVQITVNDLPAPLLYVSDTQINAIVPLAAQPGVARIRITINGARLPDFRAYVDTDRAAGFPQPRWIRRRAESGRKH
jgi:hypothetical protein